MNRFFEYIIKVDECKIADDFWDQLGEYLTTRNITLESLHKFNYDGCFFELTLLDKQNAILKIKTDYYFKVGNTKGSFLYILTDFFKEGLKIKYYNVELFEYADFKKIEASETKRILTKKSMSIYFESNPKLIPVSYVSSLYENKKIKEYKVNQHESGSIEQAWFSIATKMDLDGWDMVSSNFVLANRKEISQIFSKTEIDCESFTDVILLDNYWFEGVNIFEILAIDKSYYRFYSVEESAIEHQNVERINPKNYFPLNQFEGLKFLQDYHQYETYGTQMAFEGNTVIVEITIDTSNEKMSKFELVSIKLSPVEGINITEKNLKEILSTHTSFQGLRLQNNFDIEYSEKGLFLRQKRN
ncbi:hypothetical protein [Chondrinema litorale]|uniref:hypothetical protein n=1 Tax=Chondrinema litorale TaxID=2994555 RepID=UPI002543D580|nr:hypothetical protein [Chondrinema litorale]UZR99132.1 hypothetical protein OQ292_34560 [Chondrinema litorale]